MPVLRPRMLLHLPMVGSGAEMSPFVDGAASFSPAVGGASFSPAYSPSSGGY